MAAVSVFNPGATALHVSAPAPAPRRDTRAQPRQMIADALSAGCTGKEPVSPAEAAEAIEAKLFDMYPEQKEYRAKHRAVLMALKAPKFGKVRAAVLAGFISGEAVANLDQRALEKQAEEFAAQPAPSMPHNAIAVNPSSSPSPGLAPPAPSTASEMEPEQAAAPTVPSPPSVPESTLPGPPPRSHELWHQMKQLPQHRRRRNRRQQQQQRHHRHL